MCIANLIIKPISAFLLYRIYKERGGNYGDLNIPGIRNIPGFGRCIVNFHHLKVEGTQIIHFELKVVSDNWSWEKNCIKKSIKAFKSTLLLELV